MFSLIKNKQYSKLSYKLGFYSAMLGFIEWFYWIIGVFINLQGWDSIAIFLGIALVVAMLSILLEILSIVVGIIALKKDEDKKSAKKGIIYGILGFALLACLWFFGLDYLLN